MKNFLLNLALTGKDIVSFAYFKFQKGAFDLYIVETAHGSIAGGQRALHAFSNGG